MHLALLPLHRRMTENTTDLGKKPGNVAVSSHISLEGPRDSATCVPIPVNTLRWEREHPQLVAGSPAKGRLNIKKTNRPRLIRGPGSVF